MSYLIVGLGNPGEKYENTRHNVGWITCEVLRKAWSWPEWEVDKKLQSQVTEGKIGKEKVLMLRPETMMNNSGKSLASLIKNKKQASQLLVIHDDLDLPLGLLKISWNRGTGGHRGLDSVVRQIKTQKFIRLRIGIAPVTPSGKTKKPAGEEKVLKHILGDFKPTELAMMKKLGQKIASAIEAIVTEGKDKAMTLFN